VLNLGCTEPARRPATDITGAWRVSQIVTPQASARNAQPGIYLFDRHMTASAVSRATSRRPVPLHGQSKCAGAASDLRAIEAQAGTYELASAVTTNPRVITRDTSFTYAAVLQGHMVSITAVATGAETYRVE